MRPYPASGLKDRDGRRRCRRMNSFRSDEQRKSLVSKIKLISARDLDPRDLHRYAVKEAADLSHLARQPRTDSHAILYDDAGAFRVKCSEAKLESLDLAAKLAQPCARPHRIGRYGSAMSAGYATDAPLQTRHPREQTRLDQIMKNGRKYEDRREDELSQQVDASRYQQALLDEEARQAKESRKR